jgi:hypothetical protein
MCVAWHPPAAHVGKFGLDMMSLEQFKHVRGRECIKRAKKDAKMPLEQTARRSRLPPDAFQAGDTALNDARSLSDKSDAADMATFNKGIGNLHSVLYKYR